MDQLVQIFGSLLILVAFIAAQRGALSATSRSYLLSNLIGSTILTILAAHERQWGFLLLESCWAVVSGYGLVQHLMRAGSRHSAASGAQTTARLCDAPTGRGRACWMHSPGPRGSAAARR